MKIPKEFQRIVSFRVDDGLYRRIRAAALADDRRPGPFLRRVVAAALREAEPARTETEIQA